MIMRAENRVQAQMDLLMLSYRAADRSNGSIYWRHKFEKYLVDDEEISTYRKARAILELDTDKETKIPHQWRPDGICRNCFIPNNAPLAEESCGTSKGGVSLELSVMLLRKIKRAMRGRFQIHGSEIHKLVMDKLVNRGKAVFADVYETERYIRRLLITGVLQEYRHAPTDTQRVATEAIYRGYQARIERGERGGFRTHFWYIVNWSKLK